MKTKGQITREKIISEATRLIVKQGYTKTSINDIILATGVKKGNLYFHFPSKDELGFTILQEAKITFFNLLESSLSQGTSLEKLSRFFDAVAAQQQKTRFVGGCLFGNLALELGDSHPDFSKMILEVFNEWIATLASIIHEAKDSGELQTNLSAETLARHIVATIEGGIMLSRINKSAQGLEDCIRPLRLLLSIKE
ncbi:MAG: TetR/AcrR family transcriptional regulator [Desulfobulbaceae bacterium]|nr:TetR/AcrR family transcriptional regulator [Desulfobulbaceae bacterium]